MEIAAHMLHTVHHWSDLPRPVLEIVLVSHTSYQCKKSLRQTCKLFRDVLDACMTSLTVGNVWEHTSWLKRVQLLRTVTFLDDKNNSSTQQLYRSLDMLTYLPTSLTAVSIRFQCTSLEPLASLKLLSTLQLYGSGPVTGLQELAGLTRLHTNRDVGSVAHLAPTLAQLSVGNIKNVDDVDKLRNLTVLQVAGPLPRLTLQNICNAPLHHLEWHPALSSGLQLDDVQDWEHAPPTLSSLCIFGRDAQLQPGVLPSSITRIQLLNTNQRVLDYAAYSLPSIRHLDIGMQVIGYSPLKSLTSFTSLRSLNVWLPDWYGRWKAENAIAHVADVAQASERGVAVTAVECQQDLYLYYTNWPRAEWRACAVSPV